MDKIVVLTEMSVFYTLSSVPPLGPFWGKNDHVLCMIDPRGKEIERIISKRLALNDIPEWITNPKTRNLRLIYDPLSSLPFPLAYEASNENSRTVSVITRDETNEAQRPWETSKAESECKEGTRNRSEDQLVRMSSMESDSTFECTYNTTRNMLVCTKINYSNKNIFYNVIKDVFQILETDAVGEAKVLYKGIGAAYVSKSWNKEIFADIITNNENVNRFMAINETSGTLGNKHILPITVSVGDTMVRAVITENSKCYENKNIVIRLSRLIDYDMAKIVIEAFCNVMRIYDELYTELVCLYADYTVVSPSRGVHSSNSSSEEGEELLQGSAILQGMDMLRKELPELFVKNYTRECPIPPIMLSYDVAQELIKQNVRVIFYPKNDVYGRYYTAPLGRFVGLKVNRLNNRDRFPYLVGCYLYDHMNRPNSDTYKYYMVERGGKVETNDSFPLLIARRLSSKFRPVPRSISAVDTGYSRTRVGFACDSLIKALETATGKHIDRRSLPWVPQLVRQELWDVDDNTIMSIIRGVETGSSNPTYISGSLMFRYFEELLQISIHVVVIRDGKFNSLIPRHIHPYIWDPPYPRHVVLFENIKKVYGKICCFHEVLVYRSLQGINNITVFDISNDIVSSIVEEKRSLSARVVLPSTSGPTNTTPTDTAEQLIDDDGKCRIIRTIDGNEISTFTRPIRLAVMEYPECFFDDHINKMNTIKKLIGVRPTDPLKRSTRYVRYFPNDKSFQAWISEL